MEAAFSWTREVEISQLISVVVWRPDDSINDLVIGALDVITFHNYEPADDLRSTIGNLARYGRPLVCTEWMARSRDSLGETNLTVFRETRAGCINWGLVDGKTQTKFAWDDPRPEGKTDPWFRELTREVYSD